MMNAPVNKEVVKQKIAESGLVNVGKGSIREVLKLVSEIQSASGVQFIRMEMGVPGLPCSSIGLDAEIEALKKGVASAYPPMEGIFPLKQETSRFLKLFADANFSPSGCIPTVGSMQGGMAAIMVINRLISGKDTTLFIDPGFPVQKLQVKSLGLGLEAFDIYNFRGDKLREKLESYLQKGNISSILYSNPNNPSWVCLTDHELQIIGELANKYDVVIIEDLAYFGMDFRQNIEVPGEPPYQPTVRKYTENCIALVSGSKVFSYAGQRLGMMAITDSLFSRRSDNLLKYFGTDEFGHAIIYGALYALSAGTAHSAQYAMAAMLKATNDGILKFIENVREYGVRAHLMKKVFTDNGFYIVYDKDEDKPLGDGFYFTINYPGFTGCELMEELLYYGISAVTLDITGSEKQGLRACSSMFNPNQVDELNRRLKLFNEHHSIEKDTK
ncbi:MAG: pyridoxal phosphate-dependent aminotransferase [Bacteroidota bacterium]|nr:pyridoxal phosphate-dependent aminotransferase [Bacteroidota bacterium]